MLARIEESYLTILRIAVVAVAGLALLVSAVALSAGMIYLARTMLSTATRSVEGGDLARFIAERRAEADMLGASAQPETAAGPPAPPRPLSPAIDHAAGVFSAYLNRQRPGTATKDEFVTVFNAQWLQVEPGRQAEFDASLRRLADQVRGSRGRPLSRERVWELADWHHQSFRQALADQLRAAADARAEAWLWMVRAGQAFLMFVAIALYFLLVRIERHLRVVTVRREGTAGSPSGGGEGGEARALDA